MNTVKIAAVVAAAASIATAAADANATIYRFPPVQCQLDGNVYKCPFPHWFTDGLDDVEKAVVDFTNGLPASSYYCTDSHGTHDARPKARACVTYSDISTGAFGSGCSSGGWDIGVPDSDGGPGIVSLDSVGLDDPDWLDAWHDHPFGYAWIEFWPGGYDGIYAGLTCPAIPPVTFRGYRVHVN
jgi:hypothetical protein